MNPLGDILGMTQPVWGELVFYGRLLGGLALRRLSAALLGPGGTAGRQVRNDRVGGCGCPERGGRDDDTNWERRD